MLVANSAVTDSTQNVIRFSNVNKSYGSFHVLKNIDLEIKAGEVVVVCGPSGSGKSTLIRCVNGLETIDSGDLSVLDFQVTRSPAQLRRIRREVGMVFQSFNLYPHLNAVENITLALRLVKGVNRKDATAHALKLLRRVGIADKADKYPGNLSGGQCQRLAIARTLALDPKVILFDEPTSALDPEMISEVLDVIGELALAKMTMVVVTHEMGFARRVADRVLFMDGGVIIEDSNPADFFNNPRDERSRMFLSKIMSHI
jgi:ABC-type polar amino acid transport system ATPase subunit